MLVPMGRPQRISREEFFDYAQLAEAFWIEACYSEQYSNFYKVKLHEVGDLYFYHDAPDDKNESWDLLYKPLGIEKSNYGRRRYTIKQIVEIAKPKVDDLFLTSWYSEAKDFYEKENVNFLKYPIILREIEEGFEVIDGNHRLLVKCLKHGFKFDCPAYVCSNRALV